MRRNWKPFLEAGLMSGILFCAGGTLAAQASQSGQGSQSQPPAQQSEKPKTPDTTPLTLDAPPPVNAEEDAAYKAFQDISPNDSSKKIEVGEAFVQKYSQSRYLPPVYSGLVIAYMQANQVQKMLDVGDKAVALTPTDVTTLAILAQTISRVTNSHTPDASKQLEKAETYSKRAIEVAPTLPKPPNLTDDAFTAAKNQALATAHSGLGLVYVKRGKSAEAIPELEASIKLDPTPDPVNYYLLGVADKSAAHFDDAVTAFSKCAAIAGPMQTTCKTSVEDAKKLAATQLSAPK